jgi:predicted transcriptional regulator
MSGSTDFGPIQVAARLAAAWLANPNTRAGAAEARSLLVLLSETADRLSGLDAAAPASDEERFDPAVTVRKSLSDPDRIISMIDGKPYTSLKRHLSKHGLTPDEYRARYRLKADYPMVAVGFSARRRELAERIGLGRKPVAAVVEAASVTNDGGRAAKRATPRNVRRKRTPSAE